VVVKKGTLVEPPHLGVFASLGRKHLQVHKIPEVAILTTGDELVRIDGELKAGQIRDSNSYGLAGLTEKAGCTPRMIGTSKDDKEELTGKIRQGLESDVLVTSGGISVGNRDYVLDVLKSLGAEIVFWKVNIKPGMPMAFALVANASCRRIPVFALPGNPVSSMVTFLQLVRPGLERIRGVVEPVPPLRLKATLKCDLKKVDAKRHYVRGVCRNEKGVLVVESTGSQSSAVLTSLTLANCLIVVPENVRNPRVGEQVEVELL
jgi:molybdopterin molybdotransferase